MKKIQNKSQLTEILIISLLISISYFLIIMDGTPIFIGPFNNIDNSIAPARTVDVLVSLGIIFSFLYYLYPKLLIKREYKKFLYHSFIILIGFSAFEFFSDEIILYYYQIPAEPELVYELYNLESRQSYDFTILPGNLIVFLFSLLYAFTKAWIINERNKVKSEKEKLKAEVDFLRSQINPHFLFNSLNNIYAITQRNKDDEAGKAITKLSSLLRFMIYEGSENKILLQQEIELINNFIEINKLRFSQEDNIKINFIVKGDIKSYKIAPLILIPFVENAFKHGISTKPEGEILISIILKDDYINFTVENAVFKKSYNLNSYSGIGLLNVKKRLSLLYKDDHSLVIEEKEDRYISLLKIKLEKC